MTSNPDWTGSPEEGEIIETSDLTSNGFLYQFCVPDDTLTTDTNTTTTVVINTIPSKRPMSPSTTAPNEPPLKRQKVSITIPNPYPTLTIHSPHTSTTKPHANTDKSPSPSPIYYYTQNHRSHMNNRARRRQSRSPRKKPRRRNRRPRRRNRGQKIRRPRYRSPRRISPTRHPIHSKSHSLSASSNDTIDLIQTRSKLEILKQKAMESVRMNRNQLNPSGLLKEDRLEHSFNTYSLCKSIVMNIMDSVSIQHNEHYSDEEGINDNQTFDDADIASLRALALKSLLIPSQTPSKHSNNGTDTNTVDMDISPDIVEHGNGTESEHNDDQIMNDKEEADEDEEKQKEEEIQHIKDTKKQEEMNAFAVHSHKLTLILSQIRRKTGERNALVQMASSVGKDLHTFIDTFALSQDLHELLDGLIAQHTQCSNCRMNDVKCRMELERQKQSYETKMKKVKRMKKKEKHMHRYRMNIIKESVCQERKEVLNETIQDLDIDTLYGIDDEYKDTNLYQAYSDIKEENIEEYTLQHRALMTTKICTNLVLYYQDHMGFVEQHQEKKWEDLDFMKEYSLSELTAFD